ncbi:TIGR04076 family protein [Sedimentibacter sp.]|uniref:TIGR04076 family protein n=1 Tax=Sedimentibacter sp. TaxID=1960295 RepID=UPI0028A28F10|nr:TIGR04076 family protein [Sedimentibacter sp.]
MERKKKAKVKITVLKTLYHEDLVKEYLLPDQQAAYGPCYRHHVGQEFIIDSFDKPEGFCSWAWSDIHREFISVMFNADFPNFKDEGTIIATCTDGLRPVVFKVERIDY